MSQVKKDLTAFLKKKAKGLKSDWNDVPRWVIDASAEFAENLIPTSKAEIIENANRYLSCCESNEDTIKMIKAIAAHEDGNDLIDNVEDAIVWQKVENSFTCDDFLEEIGYFEGFEK